MTTLQIAIAVLLVWMIAGLITVKLARRAGYPWGWFDGAGWRCRIWVLLQAPGAIVDTFLSDIVWVGLYREAPLTLAHAFIFWAILVDPKLDAEAALRRFNGKP